MNRFTEIQTSGLVLRSPSNWGGCAVDLHLGDRKVGLTPAQVHELREALLELLAETES